MQLRKFSNRLALSSGLSLLFALSACSHLPNQDASNTRVTKVIESVDLAEITTDALELADLNGASKVLVIFDIDNTLLTMPQDLGGDGWFGWQSSLLESDPNSPSLAVSDFSELIYLQGALFSLGDMTLTQPEIPSLLSSLHTKNIPSMAVTARGHEFRGVTLRELEDNGISFPLYPECKEPLCAKSGLINSQIISDSISALRNLPDQNKYRDISISDGLVMLAGQDKGLFLEIILESLQGHDFTHILVADDSKKNIDNYEKSARNIDANLILYHYTKIENELPPIESSTSRKQKIESDTLRLKRAICLAVKSTWCELPYSP